MSPISYKQSTVQQVTYQLLVIMFSAQQFLKSFAPANTSTPARTRRYDFSSSDDEDDIQNLPREKVARGPSAKKNTKPDPFQAMEERENVRSTTEEDCITDVTNIFTQNERNVYQSPNSQSGNEGE